MAGFYRARQSAQRGCICRAELGIAVGRDVAGFILGRGLLFTGLFKLVQGISNYCVSEARLRSTLVFSG